ncbi:hypothetical protein [Palleronia caenipelagi]|uniref:Sulfotransferase domain-containing protein n=1 Tax=Palleronia caenipelagi TaxID=2489174 RepID=A0A547PIT1_9RHOB|nr:hypothetical protein [Palleronia caenipelagi]TRD14029.1 hypothetical protein FEV53_19605 [Palleronia caenipelagi]
MRPSLAIIMVLPAPTAGAHATIASLFELKVDALELIIVSTNKTDWPPTARSNDHILVSLCATIEDAIHTVTARAVIFLAQGQKLQMRDAIETHGDLTVFSATQYNGLGTSSASGLKIWEDPTGRYGFAALTGQCAFETTFLRMVWSRYRDCSKDQGHRFPDCLHFAGQYLAQDVHHSSQVHIVDNLCQTAFDDLRNLERVFYQRRHHSKRDAWIAREVYETTHRYFPVRKKFGVEFLRRWSTLVPQGVRLGKVFPDSRLFADGLPDLFALAAKKGALSVLQAAGEARFPDIADIYGLVDEEVQNDSVLETTLAWRDFRTVPSSPSGHAPPLGRQVKRIILHVGLPKCGSSALQHMLAFNRVKLIRQGMLFPASGIQLATGVRRHRISGHYKLFRDLLEPTRRGVAQSDIAKELRATNWDIDTLILSSEGITWLQLWKDGQSFARICQVLAADRLDVVYVTRDPGNWTRSLYKELCTSFQDEVPRYDIFRDHLEKTGLIEHNRVLERLKDIAPNAHFHTCNLDMAHGDGLLDWFFDEFSIDRDRFDTPSRSLMNTSYSNTQAILFRDFKTARRRSREEKSEATRYFLGTISQTQTEPAAWVNRSPDQRKAAFRDHLSRWREPSQNQASIPSALYAGGGCHRLAPGVHWRVLPCGDLLWSWEGSGDAQHKMIAQDETTRLTSTVVNFGEKRVCVMTQDDVLRFVKPDPKRATLHLQIGDPTHPLVDNWVSFRSLAESRYLFPDVGLVPERGIRGDEVSAVLAGMHEAEIVDLTRPWFDHRFYLANNRGVTKSGIDPSVHFHREGWKDGRRPNGWFDTSEYMDLRPRLRTEGLNPFAHFILSEALNAALTAGLTSELSS